MSMTKFDPLPIDYRFQDLTGLKFGRLTFVGYLGKTFGTTFHWECRCDCGKTIIAQSKNIKNGRTKSCGCFQIETIKKLRTTHGECQLDRRSPEYRAWAAMKSRCNNPKGRGYEDYGGRGIKVCDKWSKSFEDFLADMGRRPSPKHSLDRFPNNDGNYEPDNCRWATPRQQNSNTRKSLNISIRGETKCLSEWARISGNSKQLIHQRLKKGWEKEKAIFFKQKKILA
jgi:hypothetical protein